jgi:hypothetical protein
MGNKYHKPKGAGGGQFTSGGGGGGDSSGGGNDKYGRAKGAGESYKDVTRRENAAIRAIADRRKLDPNRTSIRKLNPPTMYASTVKAGQRGERVDLPVPAHGRGVENATAGKKI